MLTGTMHYIDHDLCPERNDPSHAQWQQDEMDNVAMILNLIDSDFQSRFLTCTTTREIWNMAIADSSSEVVRNDVMS